MDLMEMRPVHESVIQRPTGVGKVFYVHNGGDSGNEGTDPNYPLSTLLLALGKCTTNKNDYIFVLDHWTEAVPIVVSKEHVHIIGTGPGHGIRTVIQVATDATDGSVFQVGNNVGYVEIAGFSLGGGNAAAGIDLYNCYGTWIHNCMFGHSYAQDTPLYGITSTLGNPAACLIEDNIFMGDGKSDGKITSNGIQIERGSTAAIAVNTIIRRNLFLGLDGATRYGAILLDGAKGVQILDNIFHVTDTQNGDAITLIDVCEHCLVIGNKAAHGMGVGSGNDINPYRDLNTNTVNGWAWNSYNNAYVEPIGT